MADQAPKLPIDGTIVAVAEHGNDIAKIVESHGLVVLLILLCVAFARLYMALLATLAKLEAANEARIKDFRDTIGLINETLVAMKNAVEANTGVVEKVHASNRTLQQVARACRADIARDQAFRGMGDGGPAAE